MYLSLVAAASSGGGSVHELFRRFGASEGVAHTAQVLSVGPLRIIVVVIVAFVITRLVPGVARRLARSLQLRAPIRLPSPRSDGRAATIAAVMASVFRAIVWIVAFLTILGVFGIDLAPFVATATVIGAAVGFGAQSLVRDFLSGLLILAEDQFGVGDSITVGDTSGTVEGLNLRTTRVRSLDGVVWFIPNGEIRKVGNKSDTYNQAVVDIVVPDGTDLGVAGGIFVAEAQAMAGEADWQEEFLAPPEFWGAQGQTVDGIILRVVVKTAPGRAPRLGRALRSRIIDRLRHEGVAWSPAQPAQPAQPANPAPASES
jgi:small-conductance mechanosensitive channel